MAKLLAQRELRNNNTQVIDAVAAGETFIVTRNGEPVAELRPVRPARRTFIPRNEIVESAAPGRRIDRHQFRADLDRAIDQRI
jgi:prevent-host-death family protein